eukprot:1170521-Alexandrium_andersonii.AAC.1
MNWFASNVARFRKLLVQDHELFASIVLRAPRSRDDPLARARRVDKPRPLGELPEMLLGEVQELRRAQGTFGQALGASLDS